MTLPEYAHWWRKEWRGTFDVNLYMKICEIKSRCTDYNTISTPSSLVNGCSTAEDSASGNSESCYVQGIVEWDILKFNDHD